MSETVKQFWLETGMVTMHRLSTLVRLAGGIQRRLRRSSGGGEMSAMARAIVVSNGFRGLHNKGTSPPPSGEQDLCCNSKHHKHNHAGRDGKIEKGGMNTSLDRQLLYEGEGEPEENGVTEDVSEVCK